jgi:hypothetical protein
MATAQLPTALEGKIESVATIAFRKTGRRPSPPTVWRWCHKGVRGGAVKLQAVFHSGHWQTTTTAFDQFLADQTAAALGENDPEEDSTSDADLIAAGLL